MGKHELIKPSSTDRVRRHRAEMRAKGYKLKQVWVRDRNDPELRAQLRDECRAIAQREFEDPEEAAFWDEVSARAWDDLSD